MLETSVSKYIFTSKVIYCQPEIIIYCLRRVQNIQVRFVSDVGEVGYRYDAICRYCDDLKMH